MGGVYHPDLIFGTTTHLIAEHSEGAKYIAAIAYGIPVVTVDWIVACLDAQVRQMTKSAEWEYMATLDPPKYPCVRRPERGRKGRMDLDGRLDKPEWANAVWTDRFVDIEGPARKPNPTLETRVKMMWDDEYLYVGAEMEEPRVWGTYTEKNTVMYHENDFEIFVDPDGSRHNYYEFEMNCLNTIWELVLHRPYKDGHSIDNPSNLTDIHSAVYIDGKPNDPSVVCKKWSVEVAIPLNEMVKFDEIRRRKVQAGDTWRMNFSRVHYDLNVQDGQYVKVPNRREYNFVWSPTGVIDIHRPEKWAYVVFLPSVAIDEPTWRNVCASLDSDRAVEDLLQKIYYEQREFHAAHSHCAATLAALCPDFEEPYVVSLEVADDKQSYIAKAIGSDGKPRSIRHDAKFLVDLHPVDVHGS
ncbi:unnamed protein product [Aphanomyces euteiches]